MTNTPAKRYTVGEEIFNAVSHGVGALFGVIGTSVLVTLAACFGNARAVVACSIYGASLILLYSMSTLYHAFPFEKVKKVFRVFDHATIFILIAGSYTPFTLIVLQGTTKGTVLFWVLWAAAIAGVVLNALGVDRFEKLSMVLYLAMGWAAVISIKDITRALPTAGVVLLVAGGLAYTLGIIFYVMKNKRYMHSVWHLFVLGGSILHYLCVILYVLPLTF